MAWLRIDIVVEGQTEETFVRDVLQPHFTKLEATLTPTCVRAKQGGLLAYAVAKRDIQIRLKQENDAHATTMFVLYVLLKDFPGYGEAARLRDPYVREQHLEQALAQDIGDRRLLPYIQLHEFEALLFSDIDKIDYALSALSGSSRKQELAEIRAAFASPEDINDSRATAPSKRLKKLFPGYNKVVFGSLISEAIGLSTIRAQCRHVAGWLTRLEELR